MPEPVTISITTLPSRIGKLRPCLDSLLAAEVVPDKIYLPLPKFSRREQSAYTIPDFLTDRNFCGSIIEIVPIERDFGPGTKLIGVLDRIAAPCHLVIADDDVRYHPSFLAGLLAAQRSDPRASFSYHTYRTGGLVVGQGCDGFSFYSPNLAGIRDFYDQYIDDTPLFYHDDLWISFFLASKGIAIRSVAGRPGGGSIYEVVHQTGALRLLTGEFDRRRLNRNGIRMLLRQTNFSWRTKLRMKLIATYDHLITSPTRRIRRKTAQAARVVGRSIRLQRTSGNGD